MRMLLALLALTATPAMAAAGKPFFSLSNTDFIVSIGFIVFIGILLYYKVPAKITGLLDGRAAQIKAELEEARALRDEAKACWHPMSASKRMCRNSQSVSWRMPRKRR